MWSNIRKYNSNIAIFSTYKEAQPPFFKPNLPVSVTIKRNRHVARTVRGDIAIKMTRIEFRAGVFLFLVVFLVVLLRLSIPEAKSSCILVV